MKPASLTLGAAVLLFSLTAVAGAETCKKISGLAHDAMKARQDGALLEDSMERVGDGSKFAKDVVMQAYQHPVSSGKEEKLQAITEFQNEAYRVCYNADN